MLVNPVKRAYLALESWFNISFGSEWNPLYHLGTLSFFLFWIILVTGLYLFIPYHGSIAGAYASMEYITHEQWYVAGIMRSMHRYASDAVVITILLHMFKEFASGRFRGFRWFSWVTGVPTLWMVVTLGITGYWLVWDELAQYVAIGSAQLMDALPIFSGAMTRNFVSGGMTDRFFILIEFLHLLGQPMLLLFMLWLHVKRMSHVAINPPRGLAMGTFFALLALSLYEPALSHGPANLDTVPRVLQIDWFYLNVYPLLEIWPAQQVWMFTTGLTVLLMAMPWLMPKKEGPAAVVDLEHCNGCGICFEDCPFDAITMQARTDGARYENEVVVNPSLCASCGICAGSCPASNPFRSSRETLKTGIDMPQLPVDEMRRLTRETVESMSGHSRIIVFGCEHGLDVARLDREDTRGIKLICSGMLPPTLVEYALKQGADGVMVTGCRENDCFFRFGNSWTRKRFTGDRKPILRARAERQRIRMHGAAEPDLRSVEADLEAFRKHLVELNQATASGKTGTE
ncbi:MAG: hydrogenase iron-sulfur subunit [Gammaproteobacteria bacterium]|nr:MAG: hydrogenase iron-sulfur subunit [Gammaproteobacteria bacterium]UCH39721.1 MAG: hydrogenase iron-sulfur subunit [Gammaproteobacteria bacterium]